MCGGGEGLIYVSRMHGIIKEIRHQLLSNSLEKLSSGKQQGVQPEAHMHNTFTVHPIHCPKTDQLAL